MSITETLLRYPEIELYSREKSYNLYQLIKRLERDKSALIYLAGLSIPAYAALTLMGKIVTDACRVIHTIVQSITQREFASGNLQSLLVDVVEYLRCFCGIIAGAWVALYDPVYAAETFLTVPTDPKTIYLTEDEGARLYAIADRLHAFFVTHQINYRMCCGTALGAFREQGIIRNDDDMDLMIHPDSVEKFKQLCSEGAFTEETGVSIQAQEFTGGWQCFYADSPRGAPNSPLEHIGKPFIDIFPGTRRLVGGQSIISYANNNMYYLSKGDYFTDEEWGLTPTEYSFGPTRLYGIEPDAMKTYLRRSYGPSALEYVYRIYPHDTYSSAYANPLQTFSIFAQHPLPRALKHIKPAPLGFDSQVYNEKIAQSSLPFSKMHSFPRPNHEYPHPDCESLPLPNLG